MKKQKVSFRPTPQDKFIDGMFHKWYRDRGALKAVVHDSDTGIVYQVSFKSIKFNQEDS